MKEVEVKIKNINKRDIIKKVTDLGAQKIFSGKVIDFRFDTPERDLSRQGKALRIRQKGRHIYLNVKGKKKSVESIHGREELGVRISNFKTMQKMLQELGYIKIFELTKYRTEYRLKDINFDIDEYIGLDPILEIESTSYDKVEKYIKKLEINEEDIGRVYIREILAAKKKYDEDLLAKRREQKRFDEDEEEDNVKVVEGKK